MPDISQEMESLSRITKELQSVLIEAKTAHPRIKANKLQTLLISLLIVINLFELFLVFSNFSVLHP